MTALMSDRDCGNPIAARARVNGDIPAWTAVQGRMQRMRAIETR
jgi:hypothetical protein